VFEIGAAILLALGLVVAVVFAARSCDDEPSESGSESTTVPHRVLAPLTGLEMDGTVRPALMVKIDDVDAARPQDGLFAADVVFEEMVEGGLTRFGAVYSSTDPGTVGPIRSVRDTDLAVAQLLGRPVLAFSGGAVPILARVAAAAEADSIVAASPLEYPNAFFRRRDRVAPHNLYARASELWATAEDAGTPDALFVYGAPAGGLPVSTFTVSFPTTQVAYRWNPDRRTWLRSQNGSDQVDATRPDETFGVDNVVVLHVGYQPSKSDERSPVADLGGGDAWVYRDGSVSGCRWSIGAKPAPRVALVTETGTTCPLTPGRTIVELAPSPPTVG
jgi:hypothetical protein